MRALVVSPYADDISIVVRDQKDVQAIVQCLKLCEKAVSAKVNWAKCKTLQLGQWDGEMKLRLSGGLHRGSNGFNMLDLCRDMGFPRTESRRHYGEGVC